MPAERSYGMDHSHYRWSPIRDRARLVWPGGARVALCVIISLEHTEWQPPEDSAQASPQAAGMIPRPYPDYSRLTHREYGHRVGIFRLLDVLEKHGVAPTIAIDALTGRALSLSRRALPTAWLRVHRARGRRDPPGEQRHDRVR